MKTSVENLSATRVKLTVNVPFDELSTEIDQAYAAIAQQVNIPGFRKGKAPRRLIDARFGRGPILEQVINDMLPSRYQRAVEETEQKVIGQPEIDIAKIEDNDFVEFTAEVDIRPEIEVPDFSEFSVTVPAVSVDDEAVEKAMENLRSRFGELKPSEDELAEGDFAVIDVVAEVDGEQIDDATTEGLSYEIGSDDLIVGLDEALTGLKAGADAEFTAKLNTGDHAGEEATIKVHVKETKKRVLPELDDEFAQMASEFDTVEELRDDTRNTLKEARKGQQAAAIRDEVLKEALSKVEFELPETVVDEQVHNQLHQLLGQLAHDEKALAQLLEAQGTTREEFDKKTREQAEESVRTQLFLDTLADEEDPDVSQQELTDHILFTAQSYGMDPNQFVQQIQQAGQLGNLFADLRRGKALAAAICRVSVTDDEGETVDPSDFFGDDESEADAEASADAETKSESEESASQDAE